MRYSDYSYWSLSALRIVSATLGFLFAKTSLLDHVHTTVSHEGMWSRSAFPYQAHGNENVRSTVPFISDRGSNDSEQTRSPHPQTTVVPARSKANR